jgi:predicted DNA-binding helix-hairpin-helix protein
MTDGNMELARDPKRAWAERYLREVPLEIMTARRDQLLRIPGIGPVAADAILKARRQGNLTSLTDLRRLGIRAPEQASSYILLNGRKPLAQQSLF